MTFGKHWGPKPTPRRETGGMVLDPKVLERMGLIWPQDHCHSTRGFILRMKKDYYRYQICKYFSYQKFSFYEVFIYSISICNWPFCVNDWITTIIIIIVIAGSYRGKYERIQRFCNRTRETSYYCRSKWNILLSL